MKIEGLKLAIEIKSASPSNLLKDFVITMNSDAFKPKLIHLKESVESFARNFPLPGYPDM